MNVNKLKQALGTLTLMSLAIPAASAADATGWYLGLSSGESRATFDVHNITEDLLESGFTTTSFRDDHKEFGYKLLSGYRFNEYFAVEGGYFDLGKFNYLATTVPAGSLSGELGYRGVSLDLIAIAPLSERWGVYGRFGAHHARSSVTFAGTGAVNVLNPRAGKTSTDFKAGLGIEYQVSDVLDLRLEAERYRMNDAVGNKGDLDLVSFGFVYYLGRPASAPVAAAPAPTPERAPAVVAESPRPATPAPAPEPQAAPEPEPLIRVSFSADSLSDFDSSEIRPEGRAELDELLVNLEGVDYNTIMVTGHTDRIGSDAYNRQLSNERASAVRDYLVRAGNIDPARISARGVGSTQAVTTLAQCGNQLNRPQLIMCLAPDRRVEVEVNGTRQR